MPRRHRFSCAEHRSVRVGDLRQVGEPEPVPTLDSFMGREKSNIDLGLAVVSTVTERGVCWSLEDLAQVCECSTEAIRQLEKRALAKLKRALKKAKLDDVDLAA